MMWSVAAISILVLCLAIGKTNSTTDPSYKICTKTFGENMKGITDSLPEKMVMHNVSICKTLTITGIKQTIAPSGDCGSRKTPGKPNFIDQIFEVGCTNLEAVCELESLAKLGDALNIKLPSDAVSAIGSLFGGGKKKDCITAKWSKVGVKGFMTLDMDQGVVTMNEAKLVSDWTALTITCDGGGILVGACTLITKCPGIPQLIGAIAQILCMNEVPKALTQYKDEVGGMACIDDE